MMHVKRLLCCFAVFTLLVNVTGRDLSSPSPDNQDHATGKRKTHHPFIWLELVLAIVLLGILAFVVNMKIIKSWKEKKNAKNIAHSSPKTSTFTSVKEVDQEEKHQELVFFVEEEDQFRLENLLDAGADMQNQNYCSSLYKVQLNNNVAYAVKRLKKLPANNEEFDRTMAMVGKLNHPNILPLVAYSCQGDEKLLIYKYQNKGSLLSLMESKLHTKTLNTTESYTNKFTHRTHPQCFGEVMGWITGQNRFRLIRVIISRVGLIQNTFLSIILNF